MLYASVRMCSPELLSDGMSSPGDGKFPCSEKGTTTSASVSGILDQVGYPHLRNKPSKSLLFGFVLSMCFSQYVLKILVISENISVTCKSVS